jgi:hypothetical protein
VDFKKEMPNMGITQRDSEYQSPDWDFHCSIRYIPTAGTIDIIACFILNQPTDFSASVIALPKVRKQVNKTD